MRKQDREDRDFWEDFNDPWREIEFEEMGEVEWDWPELEWPELEWGEEEPEWPKFDDW